jgi:hypothetical protein
MFVSLSLVSVQGSGQDSFHTAANRRHNRWEGPTERLHSLSDLALVGFTAFREAIDRSKGPVLRVGVFVPRCGDVRISATELLETDASYAMESLPQAWKRGAWDDHFVWETKTWIQPQGVELDNLGILAEVDCPAGPERWIAPVLVYREGGSPPARISRYRLDFKPGESLKRVRLFVGRWEDQAVPEAPAVELGSQAKLMPFPIDFEVPGSFGPEADVRLTVVGEYRYREGRFKTEYRFRHVSAYGTGKDR